MRIYSFSRDNFLLVNQHNNILDQFRSNVAIQHILDTSVDTLGNFYIYLIELMELLSQTFLLGLYLIVTHAINQAIKTVANSFGLSGSTWPCIYRRPEAQAASLGGEGERMWAGHQKSCFPVAASLHSLVREKTARTGRQ